MIKFDETELPALFDFETVKALTNPAIGSYAYRYQRNDGASVRLSFNQHEGYVSLSVETGNITSSSIRLPKCTTIRVLDTVKRQFEILFETNPKLRCFIDLPGDSIITLGEYPY